MTTKPDVDLGALWREVNAARDDLEEARRMTDRSEALRASAQRRISRVLSKAGRRTMTNPTKPATGCGCGYDEQLGKHLLCPEAERLRDAWGRAFDRAWKRGRDRHPDWTENDRARDELMAHIEMAG